MFALQGTALLGLGAAVLWGGGDFSGGMGVNAAGGKTAPALRVVMLQPYFEFVGAAADSLAAACAVSARSAAGVGAAWRLLRWAGADMLLHCAVAGGYGGFRGAERAAGGGDSCAGVDAGGGIAYGAAGGGICAGGGGYLVDCWCFLRR